MATQAFFKISTAPGIPVPTFVQGVGSDVNDNNGINGNAFIIGLPNNTQGGNCIVLSIGYPFKSGRTIAISDSNGDTWPSPVTGGTASLSNMNVSTFVLQNASAGYHQLTVTFDATLKPFQYTMAEFRNVATSGALDGNHTAPNATGTAAAAGSYTPTTPNNAGGGHLIWNYAVSNDTVGTGIGTQASAISKTGGVAPAFMHANNICTIPSASSFDVQTVNGAVNPGFNFTQSSGTNFVVQSVALLAANAGAAPPAGIWVRRILHYSNVNPQSGTNNFICPSSGNLLLVTMAAGSNLNLVNSVSDPSNGTYTARATAGNSQVFDAQNATPSDSLVVNMNLNGAGQIQYSMRFFDIAGAQASSFLNMQGFNGAAPASGNVTTAGIPNITPNAAPGLTVCVTGWGTGPTNPPVASPSGAFYDIVFFTGETDQDRMDNADGSGHLYYSTTALQAWNWNYSNASRGSTLFATACCYQ